MVVGVLQVDRRRVRRKAFPPAPAVATSIDPAHAAAAIAATITIAATVTTVALATPTATIPQPTWRRLDRNFVDCDVLCSMYRSRRLLQQHCSVSREVRGRYVRRSRCTHQLVGRDALHRVHKK